MATVATGDVDCEESGRRIYQSASVEFICPSSNLGTSRYLMALR